MYTLREPWVIVGATGNSSLKRGVILDTPRYQPCPCPAGPIVVGLASIPGIKVKPPIVDAEGQAVPWDTQGNASGNPLPCCLMSYLPLAATVTHRTSVLQSNLSSNM